MAIWKLLEPLLLVLVLIFIFTQIVMAPILEKPFFWIFKKSEKKKRNSYAAMDELMTNLEVKKVEKEIKKLKKQCKGGKKDG